MIFMRYGCAKQRHDAVAQHLIHRAFKAVYGIHHDMDGGIVELLGIFRVEVPDQFSRVFDVGKADGDLFAFAF